MEPAGLTSLPVEVIHHITSYLTLQDVLSCSLTCHYLRNALNDNFVWRKYLPCDLSGLGIQEQRLTPALNIDESLSQLCESRQQFVRKTQVMNNWRQGHCVQYNNKDSSVSVFTMYKMKQITNRNGNVMYGDKYIFLFSLKGRAIEVWDITEKPVCHTVWEIKNIRNFIDFFFFVVGSYLVVVGCCKVFVYRINLPETDLPLMFSFFITDENVTFNERVESSRMHNGVCGWDHATVNNYLISSRCRDFVLIVVWDIHSACKKGCFELKLECFEISFHSFIGKNIFFEILVQNPEAKYLSVFDIEKFQFTTKHRFNASHSSYILILEDYVIILDKAVDANPEGLHDIVCSIFDFNSLLKVKERRFHNTSIMVNKIFYSGTIVNGRFVVLSNDCFHIVDALTLETVDMLKKENGNLYKIMVLFQSYFFINYDYLDQILDICDVNRMNKLPVNFNSNFRDLFYLDKFCTKLVMINKGHVSVVHFW